MATEEAKPEGGQSRPESEVLDVRDVLSVVPLDPAGADSLGALLRFRTEGDHTIISVDANGDTPSVTVQIATLEGVTGITLQQLLSNNVDIAC